MGQIQLEYLAAMVVGTIYTWWLVKTVHGAPLIGFQRFVIGVVGPLAGSCILRLYYEPHVFTLPITSVMSVAQMLALIMLAVITYTFVNEMFLHDRG